VQVVESEANTWLLVFFILLAQRGSAEWSWRCSVWLHLWLLTK